jgi:hypothetical protein
MMLKLVSFIGLVVHSNAFLNAPSSFQPSLRFHATARQWSMDDPVPEVSLVSKDLGMLCVKFHVYKY